MLEKMRDKFLFYISSLVILISLSIISLVWWQNKKEISQIQNDHCKAILNAVFLNVNNEYKSIESFRKAVVESRKNSLKDLMNVVFSHITNVYEQVKAGEITKISAQEHIKKFLRESRYDNGVGYFWINDTKKPYPSMLMHPNNRELEGKILDDPLYQTEIDTGNNIFKAFRDICIEKGEGFVTYLWSKPVGDNLSEGQPKISFVKLFEPWQWVIGTGVYIDDIEEICRSRINEVTEELRDTRRNTKIGESGYMFIFNSDLNVLVHPEYEGDKADYIINPDTGRPILEEIMDAVKNGKDYVDYRWRKKSGFQSPYFSKRTYVRYFKPLGWYICISFYFDEINMPAYELSLKIIFLTLIFIIISLLLSFFLSTSITRPLDKLVSAAVKIQREGSKKVSIPVAGTYETKKLGTVLEKMISFLADKERILQEKEQHLSTTLHSIGDAVISTDEDGFVVMMNPVAESITGYKLGDVYGKPIDEIIVLKSSVNGDKIENPCIKALRKGEVIQIAKGAVLTNKDGEEFVIADSAAPMMNLNDEVIGSVMVFRDISEHLIMEKELRQAEKMQAVGQLAGGIAHDFNNMLSGIIGASEVIKREVKTEKAQKQLDMIIKTTDRAADLVNKLLTFSRKSKNAFISVDIHKMLDESIAILNYTINKRITIINNYYAKSNNVNGDISQLQNMILNLAINAGDAMSDGGVLTILTENIELSKADCMSSSFDLNPGKYIQISIRDTGTGIPKEIMNNIFDPFFSTKEQGKGTGLGLAAVYGTVKEHLGSISVVSDEGQGTIFNIQLPVAEILREKEIIEDKELKAMKDATILLIDDEEIIRLSASELLEDFGFKVLLASNGKEGVDIYKEQKGDIDIVILDLMMPVMDGAETFHALKKENPDLKIIISSGYAKDEIVENLEEEGLAGFLKKPFRSNVLESVIQQVLS